MSEVVMARSEMDRDVNELPSSGETFADLRGRQSVRATFKLTNICIEAISIVAGQLGIKQKSLFDHLFQDTETLRAIARKLKNSGPQPSNRVQKTYVLSRNALLSLEDIARNFNAPRDILIEYSIQRLMPVIANERKRHAQRKAIFQQAQQHLEAGRRLLKNAYAELGEEDPLTERLTAAIGVFESAYKQMAAFIEKTKDIENFEPGELKRMNLDSGK
jgi:hypothetical protein